MTKAGKIKEQINLKKAGRWNSNYLVKNLSLVPDDKTAEVPFEEKMILNPDEELPPRMLIPVNPNISRVAVS